MLPALSLSSLLLLTSGPLPAGTLLTYEGRLEPRRQEDSTPGKDFLLHWACLPSADGGFTLGWLVEEEGRSGWSWLNRFGSIPLADPPAERGAGARGPALCYVRSDGRHVVELPGPIAPLPAEKLRPGSFSQQALEYRIQGPVQRGERTCLVVEVRTPYGHRRTLWVEPGGGLLVEAVETVFLAQGQEHRLTLKLAQQHTATASETAALASALTTWIRFRDRLGWKDRDLASELSTEQVAALRAGLPGLVEQATADPGAAGRWLAPLVAAAQADVQSQRQRVAAVSALRQAALGRSLEGFKLRDLAGKLLPREEFQGKVLILHFWEYRDTPLEEPYGQVGYLDYLFRRRQEQGVRVVGVHVDPPVGEPASRPASWASARRLARFMNLSYPVAVDEGDLLKQLGDPRPSGGALPLFVVVGKDGKVAEYHPGLYEVKANEGLAELDALVTRLLAAP